MSRVGHPVTTNLSSKCIVRCGFAGATEHGLEYSETIEKANALELGFALEAEVMFGGAWSLSFGRSTGRELSVFLGDASSFSGSIGSIPEQNCAEEDCRFGLFAYLKRLGDQEFEVVNYRVENE